MDKIFNYIKTHASGLHNLASMAFVVSGLISLIFLFFAFIAFCKIITIGESTPDLVLFVSVAVDMLLFCIGFYVASEQLKKYKKDNEKLS